MNSNANPPKRRIDDEIDDLIRTFNIQESLGKRLYLLEDYEIIIVCDDSGSMTTTIDGTNRTRWDELCSIVKMILDIALLFQSHGIDIYFLNRGAFYNIKNPEAIDNMFSNRPHGYTPLVPVLKHIFKLPSTRLGNKKKTLVFIATDGAPTDEKGHINVKDLEYLMNKERQIQTTHVMFLLCTDNPIYVDYLTDWDEKMVNVDVTDNYQNEKDKIQKYRGENFPFSVGDYIVKALLGAIDEDVNYLNQSNHDIFLD